MNETLIKRWNERVKKEDVIFHIGDFCFKNSKGGKPGEGLTHKAIDYKSKLNGTIIFISGNHDKNNSTKTPIERLVIRYAGKRINLVHNPEHIDFNYEINFVGHVHNKWTFNRFRNHFSYCEEKFTDCINVGVDCWNFKPVSFEEIYSKYLKWKKDSNY